MHEIKVVDESFDLKFATHYDISIQVGLDGFSFCILDVHQNKFVYFRHIPLIVGKLQFLVRKIETIFEQEEPLNATFRQTFINYSTNKSTLIPKEYSELSQIHQITDLTNQINRVEEIGTNALPGTNYNLVYCYPKELISLLNRKYTGFHFRHKSIALVNSALNQRNTKKKSLLINFEKKYIRMVAFGSTGILLYNSFYYKTETDFLYYTLNICQSLSLNSENDEILIGGYVADDSNFIRLLKKYFNNVHFLKPEKDHNLSLIHI